MGIGSLILGVVCLALDSAGMNSKHAFLEQASATLENLSLLVEGLGLRSKAVYVPSSMSQGGQRILLPVRPLEEASNINTFFPDSLFVKYGPGGEDVGLLLKPPGEWLIKRALDAGLIVNDVEQSLNNVLAGFINLARSIKVERLGGELVVRLEGLDIKSTRLRAEELLGSPLASITASVAAESLNSLLQVVDEENVDNGLVIKLKVLGPHG